MDTCQLELFAQRDRRGFELNDFAGGLSLCRLHSDVLGHRSLIQRIAQTDGGRFEEPDLVSSRRDGFLDFALMVEPSGLKLTAHGDDGALHVSRFGLGREQFAVRILCDWHLRSFRFILRASKGGA